jgi:hypothetical protein
MRETTCLRKRGQKWSAAFGTVDRRDETALSRTVPSSRRISSFNEAQLCSARKAEGVRPMDTHHDSTI